MARATLRERYPPPWEVEETPGGFRVVSSNGVPLVYIYCIDGIARSASPDTLLPSEARAIAKAVASLGGAS